MKDLAIRWGPGGTTGTPFGMIRGSPRSPLDQRIRADVVFTDQGIWTALARVQIP